MSQNFYCDSHEISSKFDEVTIKLKLKVPNNHNSEFVTIKFNLEGFYTFAKSVSHTLIDIGDEK